MDNCEDLFLMDVFGSFVMSVATRLMRSSVRTAFVLPVFGLSFTAPVSSSLQITDLMVFFCGTSSSFEVDRQFLVPVSDLSSGRP